MQDKATHPGHPTPANVVPAATVEARRAQREQAHPAYMVGAAAPTVDPTPTPPSGQAPAPLAGWAGVPAAAPTNTAPWAPQVWAPAPSPQWGTGAMEQQPRRNGAELVRRDQRRALARKRARTATVWTGVRCWWVLRGLGVVVGGVYRVVWQPEESELIKAMKETQPNAARIARRELRSSRRKGLLALLVLGGASYGAAYGWGDDLLAALPWWAYPVAAVVVLPTLGFIGRIEREETEAAAIEAGEMPRGLSLSDSDKGMEATLVLAFTEVKVRAKVHEVTRAPGGWGWEVTAAILDSITEAKLAMLERLLNTPVGGLIFSDETKAARVRYVRVVMRDLLERSAPMPPRQAQSITYPVDLATRFDGGRFALSLYAVHILLVGKTRSGKSGALRDLLDGYTAAPDQAVIGIDLTGGPDLRAYAEAMVEYVGAGDYLRAERALRFAVDLAKARIARLGAATHVPSPEEPGLAVVMDEYGLIAAVPSLRDMAEFLVTYGAKAGISVVAAAHRKIKEMMGSALLASQVHLKIYLGMDAEDAQALPKALRAQGVRPDLFTQATPISDGDAGKAFVVGQDPIPPLVRFDRNDLAEGQRRARERAPYRPRFAGPEAEIMEASGHDGVPELVALTRDAIMTVSSEQRRDPARASSEEIARYLTAHGHPIDKVALVKTLRAASDGLINGSRDTNIPGKNNPKGLYLEDVAQAVTELRERAARAGGPGA